MSAQNFGISSADLDVNPTAAKVGVLYFAVWISAFWVCRSFYIEFCECQRSGFIIFRKLWGDHAWVGIISLVCLPLKVADFLQVAEVFLTAGHAFQKLGDLTLKLNQPISENTNETKWSEREVDRLKESLTRFAQDLDNISESVQSRIVWVHVLVWEFPFLYKVFSFFMIILCNIWSNFDFEELKWDLKNFFIEFRNWIKRFLDVVHFVIGKVFVDSESRRTSNGARLWAVRQIPCFERHLPAVGISRRLPLRWTTTITRTPRFQLLAEGVHRLRKWSARST